MWWNRGITDCIVIFPIQSVCHHVQSGTLYLGQAGYLIKTGLVSLTHKTVSINDRPVARWVSLGSVTRVGNSRRNIKHV